jgi:hypothetical protein
VAIADNRNPFKTNAVDRVEFTFGTEGSNARAVTIQARRKGRNAAAVIPLRVYLSDVSTGADINAAAPSGGIAIGASGKIQVAVVAGKVLDCLTDATGKLILTITEATAKTFYVCVQLPDGRIQVSGALAFA